MISFRGELVTDGPTDKRTDGRTTANLWDHPPKVSVGPKKHMSKSQYNEFGDKIILRPMKKSYERFPRRTDGRL